mmetsp:Transcript_91477/g.244962  ORF Transcript_91477/g.244962 Transcript_91477/m.244962 type:complete len:253 (-) Transcript_91477:2480-3238(-)
MASWMVVTPGTSVRASPMSSSPPGSSPVAPVVFSVTKQVLYLRLSPTIMALEIAGHSLLMLSSIGIGATFSPPAVIISSLYRPVTLIIPSSPFTPMSPLCNQPSSSIASLVRASISATCSAPRSWFAMYPIIMCRPRKQSSPCSASLGLKMSRATGHSTFLVGVFSSALKILTCVPGAANPQLPQTCRKSVDSVVNAVDSLIPYNSLITIPSDPKYSRVSSAIGAAPVTQSLVHSSPSAARTLDSTVPSARP